MAGKALIPGSIEFGLEKLALAFRARGAEWMRGGYGIVRFLHAARSAQD